MERFDPNNFNDFKPSQIRAASSLLRQAQRGKKGNLNAQIDIIIESNLTSDLNIELFNRFGSVSYISNPAINTMNVFDLEELKTQIESLDPCAPTISINYIYWDKEGNLVFRVSETEFVKIRCQQVPYRYLLESSAINIFRLSKMRVIYTTSAQIDNPFFYVRKSFLGLYKSIPFIPRNYFRTNQFQNLIVDIPINIDIDGERGLTYLVNAGLNQKTTLNIFVSKFYKQQF